MRSYAITYDLALLAVLACSLVAPGDAQLQPAGTFYKGPHLPTYGVTSDADNEIRGYLTYTAITCGEDDSVYLAANQNWVSAIVFKTDSSMNSSVWENLLVGTSVYKAEVHPDQQSIFLAVESNQSPLPYFPSIGTAGSYDSFVLQLNATSGEVMNALRYGDSVAYDGRPTLQFDASGELYVTCWSQGATSAGSHLGQGDMIFGKYDTSGSLSWLVRHGTSENERTDRIAVDGTHIYAVGFGRKNIATSAAMSGDAIYIGKYLKTDGSNVWHHYIDGGSADSGHRIVTSYSMDKVFVHAVMWDPVEPFRSISALSGSIVFSLDKTDRSYGPTIESAATSAEDYPTGLCMSRDEKYVSYIGFSSPSLVPDASTTETGGKDHYVFTVDTSSGAVIDRRIAGTWYDDVADGDCVYNSKGDYYSVGHIRIYQEGPKDVYQPAAFRATNVTMCEPGFYYTKSELWHQCQPCPPGLFTSLPGQDTCLTCASGYVVNRDSTGCDPCTEGYYQNDINCTQCESGSISAAASVACSPCPSGYYEASNGCHACPVGTYSDAAGSSSCKECPYDSTTLQSASTSLSECTCTSDQYGDPLSLKSPVRCKNCIENAQCDGTRFASPREGYALSAQRPDYSVRCVPHFACVGERDKCDDGYEGEHCTECQEGRFRGWFQAACIPCPWEGQPALHTFTPVLLFLITPGLMVVGVCFFACELAGRCFASPRSVKKSLNISGDGDIKVCMDADADADRQDTPGNPLEFFVCWQESWPLLLVASGLHLGINAHVAQYLSMIISILLLGPAWFIPMFECFIDRVPAVGYVIRAFVLPMTIILGAFFGHLFVEMAISCAANVHHKRKFRLSKSSAPPEHSRSAMFHRGIIVATRKSLEIMMVFTFVFLVNVLDPIRCLQMAEGEWRQATSPDVLCYTLTDGNWLASFTLMIAGLPVYLFVPITVFAATIFRTKATSRTSERSIDVILKVFWYRFVRRYYWWDAFRMVIAVTMAMVMVFSVGSLYDQATAIGFIQIIKVVFTATFRPYASSLVGYVVLVSESASTVFLVCALLSSSDNGRVSAGGSAVLQLAGGVALGIAFTASLLGAILSGVHRIFKYQGPRT